MRFSSPLFVSLSLVLVPALGHAQDAGADAGEDADAGLVDAGLVDAGPVPDASPADDTAARCLDGYDRSYVEACAGKEPGAVCTFPGGESGQCAALRCLDPGARAICVATKGQPAPPTRIDGGATDAAEPSADEAVEGGGCSAGTGSSSPWVLGGLFGLVLARRRACRRVKR